MKYLVLFGFSMSSLANPLTERQIRLNRWAVIRLCVAIGAVIFSVLVPFVYWDAVIETPIVVTVLFGYAMFFGIVVAIFTEVYKLASLSVLPSYLCLKVKSWTDVYPEIHEHIKTINEQGRIINMSDYYFLHAWVFEREFERHFSEARKACQALHEISSS